MKRGFRDIIHDILLVTAQPETRKSHVVYKANLNFQLAEKYLDQLERGGLLSRCGPFYETTEKGVRYIEQFRVLDDTLNGSKEFGKEV